MAQIESLTTDAIIALINSGTWPQQFALVTGTPGATVGDQLACDVSKASSLTVHVKNSGGTNLAVGTFIFEASLNSTDGANGDWFTVQGARTNANTVDNLTGTLSITAATPLAYGWKINVLGYAWFRIRNTVAITPGSVTTWTIQRGAYAAEPSPNIQSHGITGTVSTQSASALAYALVTAASTNATNVKNAATSLPEISVFNPTAAVIYVKLYNKASAPTVGTDVPLMTIPVPVNGLVELEFGSMGKRFTTGLSIAVTAGPLATDTAAVAAGAQISISYI